MHAHAVVVQAMSVQCSKQPNTAHANWDALSAGGWGKVSSILSYTEGHLHCRLPVRLSHCSRHPLLFFFLFSPWCYSAPVNNVMPGPAVASTT